MLQARPSFSRLLLHIEATTLQTRKRFPPLTWINVVLSSLLWLLVIATIIRIAL